MSYETIILDKKEGYAVLTLNRPPANPINRKLLLEMEAALETVEKDEAVRAIVITGAGEKVFSAGADLKAGTSEEGIFKFLPVVHRVFNQIENYPKPVIAAINGHALAGGCEMVLACHLRIMDQKALIGLVETTVGIFPGGGGTQRLPRLIGKGRALEYILFSTRLSAQEALQLGLVNKVVEPGKALDEAENWARRLSLMAPLTTAAVLKVVNSGLEMPLDKGLEYEIELFDEVIDTEDAREGVKAFLEKRRPKFVGR
ncbi:MAG: enoyl-CoA hydratase-related protein [Pseudomonadota bacterium]